MSSHPIVILGAGPAGVACAVQCMRLGVQPLLVECSGRCGGLVRNAWFIENYPGLEGGCSGPQFAERLQRDLERFGGKVTHDQAVSLARTGDTFHVRMASGTQVTTRHLVVATGSSAKPLGLANEAELAGTWLFYEVADLLPRRPGKVALVGSGEAAFDYALSLAKEQIEATLYVRGTTTKAGARLTERVRGTPGIRLFMESRVEGTAPLHGKLALTLHRGSTVWQEEFDAILVAVGRQSRAQALLSGLAVGLASAAGVTAGDSDSWKSLVDSGSGVLTTLPGLYICGDARLGSLGQIGIAVGDGLHAAMLAVEALVRRRAKKG